MREKAVFAEVEALREHRHGPLVSPVAFEVHVRAVDHSVGTAFPAFISDEALDSVAAGPVTTMAALELCLAGLWHRAKDGYVISDLGFVDHMSASTARRHLRSLGNRWGHRAASVCRRSWHVLNRDNFVPL